MHIIKDGTGTGNVAKVDANNRLHTNAVSQDQVRDAVRLGDAYLINTGNILLTSDGASAIFHCKNTSTRDLVLTEALLFLGNATGAVSTSVSATLNVYKNSDSGTIISTATAVSVNSNRNFGSAKTLSADVYKGTEGATVSGGTLHAEALVPQAFTTQFVLEEFLPKDTAISIVITPPAGTTLLPVGLTTNWHLDITT